MQYFVIKSLFSYMVWVQFILTDKKSFFFVFMTSYSSIKFIINTYKENL